MNLEDDINEERHIISGLLRIPEYAVAVSEYIEPDHFKDSAARSVFEIIKKHLVRYSKRPSKSEMLLELTNAITDDDVLSSAKSYLKPISDEPVNLEWLIDMSEKYIKKRAIFNALMESIEIAEGSDSKKRSEEAIPEILTDAINISFTRDLGLNYFADIEKRLESYEENCLKIPFKLAMFNKITNGGFENKTLNVVVAPTGFGKSIFLADEALFQSKVQGKNCVYFTFEMSDMRISKRFDANELDLEINNVPKVGVTGLKERFESLSKTAKGSLHVKEYPPASVTSLTLSNYIKEVEQVNGYKIDIVFVDYINLMASSRYASSMGTYTVIKGVCEELIALSKKHDVAVISATQFNRGQQYNSSPDITGISESQGLANTVDFLVALFDNEELKKMDRVVVKQLKNRYGDINYYTSSMVGINRAKMHYFDIDESESETLIGNDKNKEETPSETFSNFKSGMDLDKLI